MTIIEFNRRCSQFRRQVLQRPALIAAAFAAAGCLTAEAASYQQAPSLDKAVQTGKLPPVTERLPENPRRITPRERIGRYGGTLTIAVASGMGSNDVLSCRAPSLFKYSEDTTEVVPQVAEGYEWSEDYKNLTIRIRKGVKWSDGHPFTVEDMLFSYYDVTRNKELHPVLQKRWRPGGVPAEWRKIDDYTVRIEFAIPNPQFTTWFHGWMNHGPVTLPKHYLKRYHIRYNPKADELAQEEGFDAWWQLFERVTDYTAWNQNLDKPHLGPWIPKRVSPTYQLYERNPYYWEVDTAGNQLPYIDSLLVLRCEDPKVLTSKVAFGEVGLCGSSIYLEDYPLLKTSEEKSGIRALLFRRLRGAEFGFAFNQTCPDPVKAEMFQDVRFRRAVSLALDRDEINDVVYFGKAVPCQLTCLPICPYYKEAWAQSYAEHDPERANRLLDEMGLKWNKKRTQRLRPDGEPLSILFEFWPGEGPKTSICELIKEYLADIGINAIIKPQNGGYNRTRQSAGKTDIFSWHIDTPTKYFRRSKLFPLLGGLLGLPSIEWHTWLSTDGEGGREPPQEIKDWYALAQEWKQEVDLDRRYELAQKLFDIQAEQLYWIGTVGRAPTPAVVNERLRNVPEDGYWGWQLHMWRAYDPPQFYLEPKAGDS